MAWRDPCCQAEGVLVTGPGCGGRHGRGRRRGMSGRSQACAAPSCRGWNCAGRWRGVMRLVDGL